MIKIVIKFTYNFQENHHFRKKKTYFFDNGRRGNGNVM